MYIMLLSLVLICLPLVVDTFDAMVPNAIKTNRIVPIMLNIVPFLSILSRRLLSFLSMMLKTGVCVGSCSVVESDLI